MRNYNSPNLKSIRKDLRKNPTYAEKIFWNILRGNQLEGRKFRRQHGIGNFIVDFYCPEERLIIEIDGSIHALDDVKKYDSARETELVASGHAVMRFRNEDVIENTNRVIETIRKTWEGRERDSAPMREHRHRKNTTPLTPPLAEAGQ